MSSRSLLMLMLTSVPPNCRFEVDDAEDEWNFTYKFDYIHGRALMSCFNDASFVVKQAYNALEPGCYFELQDCTAPWKSIDNTLEGTTLWKWHQMIMESAEKMGRSLRQSGYYKQYMEDAGFVDVVEKHFQWPLNPWPKGTHHKTLGAWFHADIMEGFDGLSMAFLTRGGRLTPDEVKVLLVDVRKDFADRRIHAYAPIVVVYGRKPE